MKAESDLKTFVSLIRDAGGYFHPDLRLLVGDEAEHGKVSLAGVDKDTLSLKVPYILGETLEEKGPWLKFLEGLGYEFDLHFQLTHTFGDGFYPLIGAANHSDTGGRLDYAQDCLILYGTDFCYSKRSSKRALHGIIDG